MNASSDKPPVILVFGGQGQLGRALATCAPSFLSGTSLVVLDRAGADITKADDVRRAFDVYRPVLVINAAAYTAVDAAETNESLAFLANALGPHRLASACAQTGIPMLHISTDYVFPGHGNTPWKPCHATGPVNAYGRSKLAGEWAVQAAHRNSFIIRTSWVFSPWGNNFVKSMLRLGATREEMNIVCDQYGCPTSAVDLAEALLRISAGLLAGSAYAPGIYHFSNPGATTWFDFANEVFTIAAGTGYARPRLHPIPSSEYPTPATRPLWSVLDCSETTSQFGLTIPTWQDALRRCMSDLLPYGE